LCYPTCAHVCAACRVPCVCAACPKSRACAGFDVDRLARDLDNLHVTYLQFFASGHVTTHPTALEHLRTSPSLGQRDLVGEIIEALHRYGIKAIPAIELGVIPEKAGASHPDWCACDADGRLQRVGESLYATCALSAYVRDYSAEIIRELLERYEVDGLYFTGFGWHEGICYCKRCREDFQSKDFQDGHEESIPTEKAWANPIYRKYIRWRMSKTTELSRTVVSHVKEIDPELPVLTGGVYFGDPDWTMRSSLDIESYSAFQDGVFSEAQSRMKINRSAANRIVWQPFIWSGEGAPFVYSPRASPTRR